ncbi:hypothetical protein [Mycoplasma sp. CB776]
MQIKLDQFYTKKAIAKKCISKIDNLEQYSIIIEPSAGEGSFSDLLNNVIAYDIEPKNSNIIKQDFFSVKINKPNTEKILIIGNPPFGYRSSLAKKFIKHSIDLNASTIAFILPNTFSKITNQSTSLFPKEWKLVTEWELPKNSFFIYHKDQKEVYHVPCTFFVWTKMTENKQKDLRKKKPTIIPKEFVFLPRGSQEADFTINGNSAKIKSLQEVTNSKSEHYIKVKENYDIELIKNEFRKLVFKPKSSINGGNYWINQDEIIIAWNERKKTRE